MYQKLLADKVANLGIGLIVASFVLALSDRVTFKEQLALALIGVANIFLGLIMYPDE